MSSLPDYRRGGKHGKATIVKARTNAFELIWSPETSVHHYDVVISPSFPTRQPFELGQARGMEIMSKLQTNIAPEIFHPRGAFDGKKNLYSTCRFQTKAGMLTSQQWQVPWNDSGDGVRKPKSLSVKIVFVRSVTIDNLRELLTNKSTLESYLKPEGDIGTSLNMLNVFLQVAPKSKWPHNARAFFTSEKKRRLPGLELRGGYFQSVRPTFDRIIVNIDYAVGVIVPRGKLETICQDFLQLRDGRDLSRLSPDMFRKLSNFLKDIKVVIGLPSHAGRKPRKIRELIRSAGRRTFEKDGETISISSYFAMTYSKQVHLDALGVQIGHRDIFPIQFCETTGDQVYKNRLSPEGVGEVLKFFPRNPKERLQAIERSWNLLDYAQSDYVTQAGLHVHKQPLEVEGRLLEPPRIVFGGNNEMALRDRGKWDIAGKQLKNPSTIFCWAVINFGGEFVDPKQANDFVNSLGKEMMARGMKVPVPREMISGPPENAEKILKRVATATRATFLLVILSENAAAVYNIVKRFGDITEGVATQCVRWSNGFKGFSNQYQNNLILKINAKMGGLNTTPKCDAMKWLQEKPTMVLGADVSHPGPRSTRPSISALVSSYDISFCKYVASINVQQSRREIIEDLPSMLARALQVFQDKNMSNGVKILPHRLVFYRDGVSEGEFQTVFREEVRKSITSVLGRFYGPQEKWPSLVFFIVGKRHHFRFFPEPHEADQSGNCKSGFVLDRDIVHPVYHDFYLQSHPGLKGTSRPSHYTVLVNTPKMSADLLEEVSYVLCHCYARATRAVSIPAPVYNADLVCRRAKFHFDEDSRYDDESLVDASDPIHLDHFKAHFTSISPKLMNSMYYL